jgi:lipopolysaccharide/colanic/teichoic acid biosynthesis glycosyltransferase
LSDAAAADSTKGAGALTLNIVDILCSCPLFDAKPGPNFTMFNAPVTSQRYGCPMRSLLQQLSRRRVYDSTPDQMRRLIDLVIACALFALTAPLMLLVSVAIRLEAEGPILVRESCIGFRGRRFQMLKFRTVRYDLDRSVPLWGRRPTPLGEIFRFTRIEALPQLFNVLRGEISIVDPDGRSPSFLD